MYFGKAIHAKSVESINEFGLKEWNKFGTDVYLDRGDNIDRAFQLAKQIVNEQVQSVIPKVKLESSIIQEENVHESNDEDFNKLIIELESIKFKEDAQKYIEIAGFKYNVEAKNIVNSKPSKNESNLC